MSAMLWVLFWGVYWAYPRIETTRFRDEVLWIDIAVSTSHGTIEQ